MTPGADMQEQLDTNTRTGTQIMLWFARLLQLTLLALFIWTQPALASSVEQVEFAEMVDLAELVFEGEVIASEAGWNESRTRIYTTVSWRVDEVIKGAYQEATLQLRFTGGQAGETRMEVEGQIYPQLGEQGIYFVETLQRHLINPLVGWSQGHFLIDQSHGAENATVMLADKSPLMEVQKSVDQVSAPSISEGIARGLVGGAKTQKGISKSEFKRLIRQSVRPPAQSD